jgi:hypothetical protein
MTLVFKTSKYLRYTLYPDLPSVREKNSYKYSTFSFIILVGELNNIDFNFDPRYMIPQVRTNQPTSSSPYNPLPSNEKFVFLLINLIKCFCLVQDIH